MPVSFSATITDMNSRCGKLGLRSGSLVKRGIESKCRQYMTSTLHLRTVSGRQGLYTSEGRGLDIYWRYCHYRIATLVPNSSILDTKLGWYYILLEGPDNSIIVRNIRQMIVTGHKRYNWSSKYDPSLSRYDA